MDEKRALLKQKYKVGQIVAIPLPNGKFAYAKVFNDLDLGVYDFLSDKIEPLERVVKKKFLYFSGVTDRAIKGGTFLVIGDQQFLDEESAWAPPMASGVFPGDSDMDTLHIDHKGVSLKATPAQAAGLDIRSFSPQPEVFVRRVIDRIVNGNNQKYRVKA